VKVMHVLLPAIVVAGCASRHTDPDPRETPTPRTAPTAAPEETSPFLRAVRSTGGTYVLARDQAVREVDAKLLESIAAEPHTASLTARVILLIRQQPARYRDIAERWSRFVQNQALGQDPTSMTFFRGYDFRGPDAVTVIAERLLKEGGDETSVFSDKDSPMSARSSRILAARALGKLEDPAAVDALFDALPRIEPWLRPAVLRGLEGHASPKLLERLDDAASEASSSEESREILGARARIEAILRSNDRK